MRHTTFRFALAPTSEQARILARHCGASRFPFNQSLQSLRLVTDALAAVETDLSATVPCSGSALINAFNHWKTSESAGRMFMVAPDGTTTKQVTGLSWRTEVSAQVFEDAAVDLGRALARYAEMKGQVGFPRHRRKDGTARAFVSETRRIQAAVTESASERDIPGRLSSRRSEPSGCMTTPGGCGGCSDPSSTSTHILVRL
jgi:putative transposase